MNSSVTGGDWVTELLNIPVAADNDNAIDKEVSRLEEEGLAKPHMLLAIRQKGNECFREGDYANAVQYYTVSIRVNPADPISFSNRSVAHLRLENCGYALQDAEKSIELDPTFVKGYYRCAMAHIALGRYKEALKKLELVTRALPNSGDANLKYETCKKEVARLAFERAISFGSDGEAVKEFTIDLDSIPAESTNEGPQLINEIVTAPFVDGLLTHFKDQKKLPRKDAYHILLAARELFKSAGSLVHLEIPEGKHITVCGDIHGQYYDLLNIFEINGRPSPDNPYLFNGDFVDRGSFSTECIFILLCYKLLYPDHLFLTRGNHETITMNEMYGFMGEVKEKYEEKMFKLFTEIFNYLPLCYVLNNGVAVMHGGLFSEDDVTLDKIAKIDRRKQPADSGLMCEILWSDPADQLGRHPSKRGVGLQFGPDVTEKFCKLNNLKYIVRSHEMMTNGIRVQHDGRCITVFSAPNYCDSGNNEGGFLRIKSDLEYEKVTFKAVPHPEIRPMAYSSTFLNFI